MRIFPEKFWTLISKQRDRSRNEWTPNGNMADFWRSGLDIVTVRDTPSAKGVNMSYPEAKVSSLH